MTGEVAVKVLTKKQVMMAIRLMEEIRLTSWYGKCPITNIIHPRWLHPGRLTWNLQITHLERKSIFQTSMIMFHVNLQGCSRISEPSTVILFISMPPFPLCKRWPFWGGEFHHPQLESYMFVFFWRTCSIKRHYKLGVAPPSISEKWRFLRIPY